MASSRKDPVTGLTRHQEAFCRGVSEGLSYLDAYKGAYECRTIRHDEVVRRAGELAKHPLVAAELGRIRERAREHCAYSVADAVAEAELARQLAMEERQASAATGAVALKAKLLGLMTDKVEQTHKQAPMSLPELEQQLRSVMTQLGLSVPDDLTELARDNVIPLGKRA